MPPARQQVTVVIPVWGTYANGRLDEAIASIRSQAEPAAVVVVDNADEPRIERDGVEIVRSDVRVSLGSARNLGLAAVRTPIVMFWDADDLMPAETLGPLVRELDSNPLAVVSGARVLDGLTGEYHHWPRRWPLRLAGARHAFAVLNAVSSLYAVTGSVMRTAAARDAGFPSASAGDDWVMGVSMAFRGRVTVRPEPGRIYRRHPGSLSASWTAADALAHARLVRQRMRTDPAVPSAARWALPAIWLGQQLVLRVLRPVARRTPRRRREGT
jgi:glycosyltransferase involved in cell wall biosynthesis